MEGCKRQSRSRGKHIWWNCENFGDEEEAARPVLLCRLCTEPPMRAFVITSILKSLEEVVHYSRT